MIGGKAPSNYLAAIQTHVQVGLDDEAMDSILQSHLIDPASMRMDDFNLFYERRQDSLLNIVEKAMGKVIERGVNTSSDETETEGTEESL